jgi:hypothetical protein
MVQREAKFGPLLTACRTHRRELEYLIGELGAFDWGNFDDRTDLVSSSETEAGVTKIEEVRAAVEAAGQRHYEAASAGDTATLDELFCEEAAYSHSNGINTPKAEYLQMVADGNYRTLKINHSVKDIWLVADDVAVVRGQQISSGKIGGVVMRDTKAASLDVWCLRDGRWQLLAHHMTLVVANDDWAKAFKETHKDA